MIKLASDIIETQLSGTTWIGLFGGLVTPVSKWDEGVEQVFPVNECIDEKNCFNNNNILIPNSHQKSLIYLEQEGSTRHEFSGAKDAQSVWTGKLRLIGFLNYKMLGIEADSCNLDYLFINELTKKLDVRKSLKCGLNGEPNAATLMINNVTEINKDANTIFGRYSYSKEMNNLLLYPYSYFGLSLEFKLTINNRCFPSVDDLVPCEPIECVVEKTEHKPKKKGKDKILKTVKFKI